MHSYLFTFLEQLIADALEGGLRARDIEDHGHGEVLTHQALGYLNDIGVGERHGLGQAGNDPRPVAPGRAHQHPRPHPLLPGDIAVETGKQPGPLLGG